MIDTSDLEICTGNVIYPHGMAHGTAFFVGANVLLTSLHVVSTFNGNTFWVKMRDNTTIEVAVKACCEENDLALLVTNDYHSENYVTLCNESPLAGISWATFGYPNTVEGLAVGSKLNGVIHNIISVQHNHDVVLSLAHGFALVTDHKGFSGSPVINAQKQVTSIMRYKDNNTLCSVSVHKAEAFLRKHGVIIQEDEFSSFKTYLPEVFQAMAPPFKDIGIAHAKVVAGRITPQEITAGLTGSLLMPKREGTLRDMIVYLKGKTDLNTHLWVTWLEFLTYVNMLKGEYADINAVYISLPQTEVSKFVEGTETVIKQDITLTLQFFFTEEKDYFNLAKQYVMDKYAANALEHNHCHVFHSHTRLFGILPFTKEDKKNVIFDISSPKDAGLNIVGNIDYGVLSFTELSTKIATSQSLTEATTNLIKIFTDAIS